MTTKPPELLLQRTRAVRRKNVLVGVSFIVFVIVVLQTKTRVGAPALRNAASSFLRAFPHEQTNPPPRTSPAAKKTTTEKAE